MLRSLAGSSLSAHHRRGQGVHCSVMQVPFEVLEHPADIGFRAWGRTREELFENAALALFSVMWKLEAVPEKESRAVEATGGDFEALLYAWLAELLALSETERLVL